jgi:hypothetical protein
MKRALIGLTTVGIIVLLLAAAPAFADGDKQRFYTVRVSYIEPQNAVEGFAVGGSFGSSIDKIVTLAIGTDVYVRNYVRDTPVATQEYASGINTTTVQREVQYTTVIFPIQAELTVEIPIVWRLTVFGHGAAGFEFLWNREQNWVDDVSTSQWFAGWTWTGGAGLMFKLGRDTDLYLQGYYKYSKVKRDRDDISEGLPVFEEVNLSGLGLRMGLAFKI